MSEEVSVKKEELDAEIAEAKKSMDGEPNVEPKDEAIVVKKAVPPKMFIGVDETVTVSVDVISDANTGKVAFVFPKGEAEGIQREDKSNFFSFTPFDFEFTIPNYEQISMYRQRSSANPQGRIDKSVLNSFILVNHLKSWTIKDAEGEIIELEFDLSGELSKDGISKINRVPIVLWDTVLPLFEREAGIGAFNS